MSNKWRNKKRRLEILQNTLLKDQLWHNQSLVGKKQNVLFEKKGRKKNQYIGKN